MNASFRLYFTGILIFCVNGLWGSPYYDSLMIRMDKVDPDGRGKIALEMPFDKISGNPYEAELVFLKALEVEEGFTDHVVLGDIYLNLGTSRYYLGHYASSVESMLKAIEHFEMTGNEKKAGYTYALLGYQMKRRDMKKAFEYMRLGVKMLEQENDSSGLTGTYNNFGVLFEMEGDLDSALYFYQQSLILTEALKDSIGIPYALNNIGGVYRLKHEFVLAEKFYNDAFEIRKKRNDLNGIAENYSYMGDLYFDQQQFAKAAPFYDKAYEVANGIKYTYMSKEMALKLAQCYENTGDLERAIRFRKSYDELKDEIINTETNKAVAGLEVQFESEKNKKLIAEQKVRLGEEELANEQRLRFIAMLGFALIIVLLISWFGYRQSKQKEARLLEENRLKDVIAEQQLKNKIHDERLRISRDLHDNIGSQLTFIISSVDNLRYLLKGAEDNVVSRLNGIAEFSRTTIGQLRDTIWAMNKESISVAELKSRVINNISAAEQHVENIRFKVEVKIAENKVFSAMQGINIFRVIQESVNNAIKYAEASEIGIIICEVENRIEIEISDNGKGFDGKIRGGGNGLGIMQKRATEIGGSVQLISVPGSGTSVKMEIPADTIIVV